MKFLIVGSDRPTNTETNQLTQALGHLWYSQRHLKWGDVEILLEDGYGADVILAGLCDTHRLSYSVYGINKTPN